MRELAFRVDHSYNQTRRLQSHLVPAEKRRFLNLSLRHSPAPRYSWLSALNPNARATTPCARSAVIFLEFFARSIFVA